MKTALRVSKPIRRGKTVSVKRKAILMFRIHRKGTAR